ncbi:MAG TPA: nitrilase-related carbon-nitrogen hydrolase [bacterium]
MRKIKLAIVQPALAEGECAANWRAARAALERAGATGADLVVLPEMWLTGYAYRRLPELAERTPESLGRVGALAKKYGYFVVGSWAERDGAGRLANTACIVGPDGRVCARYRKVHLFGPMREDRHFVAGRAACVAELEIGVVGLALCYDLRFPEQARKMALRGAELLVYPSQWPEVRLGHFHTLLAARAIENQLFTVGVNRAGRSVSVQFGGGSAVVGPRGEVLAQLGPEEGFAEVEIDLDEIAATREQITYLADRAREVDEFLYR